LQNFVNRAATAEDIGHGVGFFQIAKRGGIGLIQIGIDQYGPTAESGENDTEIHCHGRRTDAPFASGDNYNRRRRRCRQSRRSGRAKYELSQFIGLIVHSPLNFRADTASL
jgi:hypothetical protein